jgi:hypothetical protein
MKKHYLLKFIIAFTLVFGLSLLHHTPSAIADVPLEGEGNNLIRIDLTYDVAEKTYSAAGFSSEYLKNSGAPDLPDQAWALLGLFDELDLKIIGNEIQIYTNESKLFSMAFDESARSFIYDIVNVMVEGFRVDRSRAEKWLEKADFDITLRQTKELSKPLEIKLVTLLQVNLAESGEIKVEGLPTGMGLTPQVAEMLKTANIENAKICWNKGVVNGEVNGNAIPQLTLYEDGYMVVDKALNLNLGDLSSIFDSAFGLGLVLGDGAPLAGECLP